MYVRELDREQQRRDVQHHIGKRYPEGRRVTVQTQLTQNRTQWIGDDHRNDGAESEADYKGKR
jgi:hypothetical protein